jgi:nucleotide-binding universal stress UspA family protein
VPGFAKTEVSQGRGFVAEALLGSVSHQVARRAEAAVLLIPAWDKT